MPKRHDTRKEKARKLAKLIEDGPSLISIHETVTVEEAKRGVKQWLDYWVEPLIYELVPELREKEP